MGYQPISGKNIILGITGSIASYKSVDLASKLTQLGAEVDVILTEAATKFINPLTFQSVTGRQAYTDQDLWGDKAHILHVNLTKDADMLCIAPITANTIAKLAHGFCNDLLSISALAIGTGKDSIPVIIAPAMDGNMFDHEATQHNLNILIKRGYHITGPAMGHLASGLVAQGRMSEPIIILDKIRYLLSRTGPLRRKKIVVTAGGTREPIDPVRVITNLSSGKQGVAIAQSALDYGADVVLISPPLDLSIPNDVVHKIAQTAQEMQDAVLEETKNADVLIMAAAVADFRPKSYKTQKIKNKIKPLILELEPTPDILTLVSKRKQSSGTPRVTIGFAAETNDLLKNAQKKLNEKKLDMIIANDVSAVNAGFSVDTNKVSIIPAHGAVEHLPLMQKAEVADIIIQRVISILEETTNNLDKS